MSSPETGPGVQERVVLVVCWSPKGGSGTSVLAAGLALSVRPSLLVDLDGDQPAVLGFPVSGPGVSEWLAARPDAPADALARVECAVADEVAFVPWGDAAASGSGTQSDGEVLAALLATDRRLVVVDAGGSDTALTEAVRAGATTSLCVLRPCYLAVKRAVARPTASEIALVDEPGRALRAADVSAALDAPVAVTVPWDPAVARAVDAGILRDRQPRALSRPLERWSERVHG